MSTVFFGQFLGLFFLIVSLGILFNREHASKMIKDVMDHPALQQLVGILPALLGIWVVLQHNNWGGGWQLVVTLVGWLLLLVGIYRLWCVESWLKMISKCQCDAPLWAGIIMLIIGLLLLYVGFVAS